MRDLKIYILGATLLLIILLVVQYNKPEPVDWSPTYSKDDKIPYGTFILFQRIMDIVPNGSILVRRNTVFNVLNEEKIKSGNYLFIAGTVDLNKFDYSELLKFMQGGGKVFIASYYLGSFLRDTLNVTINSENKGSKKPGLQFTNSSLRAPRHYQFKQEIGVQYFSKFDTARAVVLGYNDLGHSNFLKYRFGKGALYLMPSPQFFTNFNLLDPKGAEYAAKALSHLDPGVTVVWDEMSSKGPQKPQNSLHVLLSFTELRWAYFIALLTIIIFVIFEIKRRQRIIPIIEPLKNMSLEFANIVGQVYYEKRDNSDLAKKQITYFIEHVRSRFRMTSGIIDLNFIQALSEKMEADPRELEQLFDSFEKYNDMAVISDSQLIKLNRKITHFRDKLK